MGKDKCEHCERIHRLEVALEIACRKETRPRSTYPDCLRLADEEIAKEKPDYQREIAALRRAISRLTLAAYDATKQKGANPDAQ